MRPNVTVFVSFGSGSVLPASVLKSAQLDMTKVKHIYQERRRW